MCGIFGIFGNRFATNHSFSAIKELQHRGQDSAGIAFVTDSVERFCRMGFVEECENEFHHELKSGITCAITHVRYATFGNRNIENAQPVIAEMNGEPWSMVHNGHWESSNTKDKNDSLQILRGILETEGSTIEEKCVQFLGEISAAFSIILLGKNKMIAIRDPYGFRPLSRGEILDVKEVSYAFASESYALKAIGATNIQDVKPGEMIVVDESGSRTSFPFAKRKLAHCVFELIYFAKSDSILDRVEVQQFRKELGTLLALEHPVDTSNQSFIVVPIPSSSILAAQAYASTLQIPFSNDIICSSIQKRSFIEPTQLLRKETLRNKFIFNSSKIKGKSIILVDDSIVRGNTCQQMASILHQEGAKEIHIRIASPPILWPCYFGIEIMNRSELIASTKTVEQMIEEWKIQSLEYLSLQNLRALMKKFSKTNIAHHSYCDACFSGEYRFR